MPRVVLTGPQFWHGPVVVNGDDLSKLDDVITQIRHIVDEETQQSYEQAVEAWLREFTKNEEERESEAPRIRDRLAARFATEHFVEVGLDEHRAVRVQSIEEAKSHPDLIASDPRGLKVSFEGSETRANLEVSEGSLRISIYPDDSETAQRIFGLLMSWISDVRPRPYRRLWNTLSGMQWFLLIPLLLVLAMTTVDVSRTESGEQALKQQAREVLEGGLSEGEQRRGLEILLSLQAKAYPKSDAQVSVSPAFYVGLCIALFLAIALSFTPRTAFAIGKGERVVRRITHAERLLFVSFPLLLLTGLLLPLVIRWAFGA